MVQNTIQDDNAPANPGKVWAQNVAAFNAAVDALGACDPADEAFDDCVDDMFDRRLAVLLTPSPSGTTLALKIEIFREAEGWLHPDACAILSQMAADARRLG